MPTEVLETPGAEAAPLTATELYVKKQAERAAAATPEAIAKAAADKAGAATPGEQPKRLSGDERKFRNIERRFNQQLGALKEQLAQALAAKPGATSVATPDPKAAPKRADFADDAAYDEARIAHVAQKKIDETRAADAQAAAIRDAIDAYNERMKGGPAKYDDWDAVIKAGEGAALSVDLSKECPSLFWAVANSPHNDDLFYNWCKDSKTLQTLIDTYKSGPKGETDALVAFHRFEGRVARDAKAADKVSAKAESAVSETKPKPKPSAETVVRGGTAAPDGKPALYEPGTHTISRAYKAWQRSRSAS